MPSKPSTKAVTPRHSAAKTAAAAEPNDSADQQAAEAAAETDPTPEQWEAHRAEVLARLPEEKDRPKNIYARLAQINGFIGMIKKSGWNDFHRYTFAKESDLVEEVRPMLSAYGIWIEQSLVGDMEPPNLVPHQRLSQYKSKDNVTVESLTAITKRFRFVWWNPAGRNEGETPAAATGVLETTDWVYFMGYGDDSGDKGYYKAETGAVKYFLMKTFMISTGDDPEGDTKTDRRAEAREAGASGGGQRPTRAGGEAAAPGGRQANTSAPQAQQIGKLLRAIKITSTIDAIKKLEELTGDTVPIADPEDMAGALQAYMGSLKGAKAGEVIQKLAAEANAALEASKAGDEAKAGDQKPAAAGFTEDEGTEASGDGKVWSDVSGSGDAEKDEASGADDGSIDNAID